MAHQVGEDVHSLAHAEVLNTNSTSGGRVVPIGRIVALGTRADSNEADGARSGSWRVIHLWAGGARRVELKAVHLWISRRN